MGIAQKQKTSMTMKKRSIGRLEKQTESRDKRTKIKNSKSQQ